jgi:hypothetical protein
MILVVGAGGMIGSALLEQLCALQHPVRRARDSQRSAAGAAARGAEVAMIPLVDPVTLGPALDGVDSVFLLGARTLSDPPRVERSRGGEGRRPVEQIVKLSVWHADELLTPIRPDASAGRGGAGDARRGLDVLASKLLHAELRATTGRADHARGRNRPTREPHRDQLRRRPRRSPEWPSRCSPETVTANGSGMALC